MERPSESGVLMQQRRIYARPSEEMLGHCAHEIAGGCPLTRTNEFLHTFKFSRPMEFSIRSYVLLKLLSLIKGYNLDSHPEVQHR